MDVMMVIMVGNGHIFICFGGLKVTIEDKKDGF
jgi:hypothetical protein